MSSSSKHELARTGQEVSVGLTKSLSCSPIEKIRDKKFRRRAALLFFSGQQGSRFLAHTALDLFCSEIHD